MNHKYQIGDKPADGLYICGETWGASTEPDTVSVRMTVDLLDKVVRLLKETIEEPK